MSDDPQEDPGREAALFFHGGVALLPLLSVVLIWQLGLSIPDGIFAAFLLGTLPLLSMAQLPLLHEGQVERLSAYTGSIAMLGVLTIVALILSYLGPGLEAVGLGAASWDAVGQATLWGGGGVLVLAVVFHLVERQFGIQESPVVLALIPRTSQERRLFLVLSGAAGLGEEIVFRGYLITVLTAVFSDVWTAALVSSMAFAILHAYQGPLGLVRSGLLGFLFAFVFIETGTVWPLVVLHAGVDVISGLWLGPRMLKEQGRS